MQDAQELLGRELGPNHRYHVQASIARGGFGAVYRAWDSSLRRNVALKVLIPALLHDATFVERFRREALAVARLRHRHILEIYDNGEDADGLNGLRSILPDAELPGILFKVERAELARQGRPPLGVQ